MVPAQPLLYFLFTHDCVVAHVSKSTIKFADDTKVLSLISNNDETAYREEMRALAKWCKMKEIIVDFRRQQREHAPIHIDRAAVERVKRFKFLGRHITDHLKLSIHTESVVKKAQQCVFNLKKFYRCTIESILSGCITAWYGKLYHPQPQGSPEGSEVSPTHYRGHTSCLPGHLQHPVSQEGQEDQQGHQPPEPWPVHPCHHLEGGDSPSSISRPSDC
jgi:hypothetical protein